jgi:hypothetical protein
VRTLGSCDVMPGPKIHKQPHETTWRLACERYASPRGPRCVEAVLARYDFEIGAGEPEEMAARIACFSNGLMD